MCTSVLRLTLAKPAARIALVLVLIIVALATLGPYFSPYAFDEIVGAPFAPITQEHWLGTDFLGRDTFSRFLYGGRTVLVVALSATVAAYFVAVPLGIYSGLRRGPLDVVLIAISDVIYALPPAIF
ncbi:ABC transporter permease, partial [Mesorhizobium sp. M5C.F.Ca.ET.164.01.1.1]